MAVKRRTMATVHNITTERARRGRVPWSFHIDIGGDRFVMKVRRDAKPVDLEAMANAVESWGRTLIHASSQLRKGARQVR